jgi:hypothetical protein
VSQISFVASSSTNGGILQCGRDSITLMLESIGGKYLILAVHHIRSRNIHPSTYNNSVKGKHIPSGPFSGYWSK